MLAGKPADATQTVEVAADAAEFAEVVAAGKISGDTVLLDTTKHLGDYWKEPNVPATKWDHSPTVREMLDDQARRVAEYAAGIAAKEDAARADVLAVFSERKVETRNGSYGYGETEAKYETRHAAWTADDDEAARLVPETAAWVAELTAANEAAKKAAEARSKELATARDARVAFEKAAAEQAESERRAGLGLQDGEFDYAVEDGCLMRVPCYDTSRRAKNWMAVITVDPSKPGGLDRDFAEKAHGDAYYVLPTLNPGDALEFGADGYSSRGRKTPERAYRFVVRVEVQDGNGYIVLRKCSSGKDAVKAGKKFADELTAVA